MAINSTEKSVAFYVLLSMYNNMRVHVYFATM